MALWGEAVCPSEEAPPDGAGVSAPQSPSLPGALCQESWLTSLESQKGQNVSLLRGEGTWVQHSGISSTGMRGTRDKVAESQGGVTNTGLLRLRLLNAEFVLSGLLIQSTSEACYPTHLANDWLHTRQVHGQVQYVCMNVLRCCVNHKTPTKKKENLFPYFLSSFFTGNW